MATHDTTTASMLLTDGAGTHYLLTPALLAQARISEAELAVMTGAEADDTGGYAFGNVNPSGPPADGGNGIAIGTLGGLQSGSRYPATPPTPPSLAGAWTLSVFSPIHATTSNP